MKHELKLSELTYELLVSLGIERPALHTDSSDALRLLLNDYQTERAKNELSARYGDVELIIDPDEVWFNQISINDAKWKEDHEKYISKKAAWCAKNGSE